MITKTKAAEMQLNTAIRLFFENVDHLSSYTLAAASREITDALCEKQTDKIFQREVERLGDAQKVHLSFREELKQLIKPEYLAEALTLSRKRQNWLKHADRDPFDEGDDISVDELGYVIFFGIQNYVLLMQRLTPEMAVFFHWFGAARSELLIPGVNDTVAAAALGIMAKMRELLPDLHSAHTFSLIYKNLGQRH
jgi:hypothetical protein